MGKRSRFFCRRGEQTIVHDEMNRKTAQYTMTAGRTPEKSNHAVPLADSFREQALWTRFLSGAFFFFGGCICLAGFASLLFDMGVAAGCLLISAFWIVTGVFLFKLLNQVNKYLESHTIDNLQQAVRSMKSLFKFSGISIALVFLILVVGIVIFMTVQ